MLALRLTRSAQPAVQLRRLLVAAASAGTGFLLLCALGYAMSHADAGASLLRLAWCVPPLAATVHLAVAVARTDPGSKPRPGLAAIGLGPTRLMLVSATTTALSCTLGSMLALLVFLHLRGDLTGMPFDGAAAEFLAAHRPLPLPAALTLLTLVPAIASTTVAFVLRPKEPGHAAARGAEGRSYRRFGAYGRAVARETFGAYGRFGARRGGAQEKGDPPPEGSSTSAEEPQESPEPQEPLEPLEPLDHVAHLPAPRKPPVGLPWGIAIVAAGLAVEAYAARAASGALALPSALPSGPAGVLVGWLLTAVGLALAAPGLTHLCGRLLQAVRPGAVRLLAGRVLMAEATRIGRPLGVVCAVASAAYAMAPLSAAATTATVGPLSTLGATVVTGCAVATLLTAAVEAKQARADTTAALVRLGAPTTLLRSAAALRAGALLAFFCPLTLIVAELAALPLAAR
ncbi:hypothetical protein [Streptomyces viridochromogenes]|uniref:hypothetical protein n=1 Tax=Streptomyces viridochromogenes TaxID=1938 RepID=UPI00069E9CE2|nr:hypothetical protein [Streptomyces viridochromogenes]KOG10763.1 membrane protein [Streptomyces viridochromogenes]KOG12916.1 membrane protein [Streptomyces viridochromogenes]